MAADRAIVLAKGLVELDTNTRGLMLVMLADEPEHAEAVVAVPAIEAGAARDGRTARAGLVLSDDSAERQQFGKSGTHRSEERPDLGGKDFGAV